MIDEKEEIASLINTIRVSDRICMDFLKKTGFNPDVYKLFRDSGNKAIIKLFSEHGIRLPDLEQAINEK